MRIFNQADECLGNRVNIVRNSKECHTSPQRQTVLRKVSNSDVATADRNITMAPCFDTPAEDHVSHKTGE